MTLEPDHSRRLLIAAVAGGALVCGALAAVTGEATIAMVAGVLSVAVAGLSFRLVLVPSDQEPVVEIDLDVIDVADPVPVAEPELANTRPLFDEGPAVDPETGLYGGAFLQATLDGRVAIARRVLRPLSLVLFEVVPPQDEGTGPRIVPQTIAAALRATLRESDMACRSGQNAYAMILEDTAEDGAVWTAERVRRNLAVSGSPCLFRAGVSSYPSHGLDAVELNERAERALSLARDWRRDRIEVADSV